VVGFMITASCDDEVQVYLVTGSPGDIEHLYSGITYRIQRLKQEETDSAATKRKNREDEQVGVTVAANTGNSRESILVVLRSLTWEWGHGSG